MVSVPLGALAIEGRLVDGETRPFVPYETVKIEVELSTALRGRI